jgi:hypothetical protein
MKERSASRRFHSNMLLLVESIVRLSDKMEGAVTAIEGSSSPCLFRPGKEIFALWVESKEVVAVTSFIRHNLHLLEGRG